MDDEAKIRSLSFEAQQVQLQLQQSRRDIQNFQVESTYVSDQVSSVKQRIATASFSFNSVNSTKINALQQSSSELEKAIENTRKISLLIDEVYREQEPKTEIIIRNQAQEFSLETLEKQLSTIALGENEWLKDNIND